MNYLWRKFFWMGRSLLVVAFSAILFFGCSPNNVTVDESLGRYFDSAGVRGAFGLFDNGHGHFTVYNLSRYSDSFYTPGATFEILLSLVAIQNGVVKDIPAEANEEAFYDLSKRIGKDTLRKWIDSLQYGNRQMGRDTMDDTTGVFWRDNELKINCDEQLGLLKKLYFNQLPFFARTQGIVSRMMPAEANSTYRFSYKTAQERKENGDGIGWVIGWVEENKHPYFFVVNLESADPAKDLQKTGLVIAKNMLRQLGFFNGKK